MSAMFTVCPKCALTLVVTAADLRVAQGYVRCGRCSSVFNALARLSDERQAAAAGAEQRVPAPPPAPAATSPATAPAAPAPAADAPDTEVIPDAALEFNASKTDVMAVFIEPPPNPEWTAATGSFKALIAANQEAQAQQPEDQSVDVEIDAAFLASMLQSEAAADPASRRTAPKNEPPVADPAGSRTAAPAEEPAAHPDGPRTAPESEPPAAVPPPRPAAHRPAVTAAAAVRPAVPALRPTARHAGPHTRPASGAAALRAAAHAAAASAAPGAPAATAEPEFDSAADTLLGEQTGSAALRARLLPHAWRAAVALAALLLVLQILNHYRDELAVNPRFTQPLTRLYSAFGVHLVPHWDLHAYDVRQLGASIESGGGIMTVRASIKNATQQPQPLPLLRVTLQDRFGNRIAARDVPPRFYLPQTVPASSFLSGGQRIDAEMGFIDPGTNAVGFEIDACLPASGGGIACANDAGTR
jgi:predicted Zn finger-like uncharacterized protein